MAKKEKKQKEKIELKWKTAYELLQEHQNLEKIPTGTQIDEILGGGVECGVITEFYGEYATGKSQICFTLAALVASKGEDVVFVDCESTFNPKRIEEIARNRNLNVDNVLKHIHLVEPETSDQLLTITDSLPENIKPRLIIIDGLTTLLRTEYIGRETLAERQGVLRKILSTLRQYARRNNIAVIITNQVYATPEGTPFLPLEYKEMAVGGHSLYHYSETRIFLRKAPEGKRIAKLVDSSHLPPAERPFKITEKGVE